MTENYKRRLIELAEKLQETKGDRMFWLYYLLGYIAALGEQERGIKWEGKIGGDPHNPFPLKREEK